MYHTILKKASRFLVMKSVFFLPRERRIAIERRHRGREQYGKLRRADYTVVSFGKSGRTWLRVMISRVFQVKHDLSTGALLSFDNFHRRDSAIPTVFFTHDNYIRDYTGSTDVRSDYGDRKVVLLVRHPADVTVSQYFQWKHRMKSRKVDLLEFPGRDREISLYEFLMDPKFGLVRAIDFMNLWARDIPSLEHFLMVRYE
ncbi:MAG: sulfotransferase, partial [Gammaproteobacteria bacterium]